MSGQTTQVLMQEYRVTFRDQTEKMIVRENTIPVTNDFENADNPIHQIQLTRVGLNVALPVTPQPVFFKTVVTPQAAADGFSIAAPSSYTVNQGTEILLEAIPGAGYQFVGWFLSAPIWPEDADTFDPTDPVSETAITKLVITAPGPGQERVIEARFAPCPGP